MSYTDLYRDVLDETEELDAWRTKSPALVETMAEAYFLADHACSSDRDARHQLYTERECLQTLIDSAKSRLDALS